MGTKITRPIMRYYGGKFRLRHWIIEHFPAHRFYCEPFGGAASVLMAKEPAPDGEAYNDLNFEVGNVFKVMRNPNKAEALKLLLKYTPYSQDEFKLAATFERCDSDVERARKTIVRSFMGVETSGTAKQSTGLRMKNVKLTSGNYRNVSKEWAGYHEAIDSFTERLNQGVAIWNQDAFDIIDQFEAPETLFYLDPPYTHDTRAPRYAVEFSQEQHERLIERLLTLDAMVVLSGYGNPLYERLNWHCEKKEAYALGHGKREECLWLNPAAREALQSEQKQKELCLDG